MTVFNICSVYRPLTAPQSTLPTAVFGAGAKMYSKSRPAGASRDVTGRRSCHQERRITHQASVVDDVAECLLPCVAENDGVVADAVVDGATAQMRHDRRRRRP